MTLLLVAVGSRARADTFDVTDLGDGGTGSLRSLIAAAHATAGDDVIHLLQGVHRLAIAGSGDQQGDLDIRSGGKITLVGHEGGSVVEQTIEDRVFHVHPGGDLEIRNVVVKGGSATDSPFGAGAVGGGVLNEGRLRVFGGVILDNRVRAGAGEMGAPGSGVSDTLGLSPLGCQNFSGPFRVGGYIGNEGGPGADGAPAYGGGIYNVGELFLESTLIAGNVATGGAGGVGGLGAQGEDMSAVVLGLGFGGPGGPGGVGGTGGDAAGGGVYSAGTGLTVTETRIERNLAIAGGGGAGGHGGAPGPLSGGGCGANGGDGGIGGAGGAAHGGGLHVAGPVSASGVRVLSNRALAGAGGAGGRGSLRGEGSTGAFLEKTGPAGHMGSPGEGGPGGVSAGGGLYLVPAPLAGGDPPTLADFSALRNSAVAGDGGNAGPPGDYVPVNNCYLGLLPGPDDYCTVSFPGRSASGGPGGEAFGGAVAIESNAAAGPLDVSYAGGVIEENLARGGVAGPTQRTGLPLPPDTSPPQQIPENYRARPFLTGADGAGGGSARGGGVAVVSPEVRLLLSDVSNRKNQALGGLGAGGRDGFDVWDCSEVACDGRDGSDAGAGGAGGHALGGGLFLTEAGASSGLPHELRRSSLAENVARGGAGAPGGVGGDGGDAGGRNFFGGFTDVTAGFGGRGGAGGDGGHARGGGVFTGTDHLVVENVTASRNEVVAGEGGDGGKAGDGGAGEYNSDGSPNWDCTGLSRSGGDGGAAGDATGGGLGWHTELVERLEVRFATVVENRITAASAGAGGALGEPGPEGILECSFSGGEAGEPGDPGTYRGGGVWAGGESATKPKIDSACSIYANNVHAGEGPDFYATLGTASGNLFADSTDVGSPAGILDTDPQLRPLAFNGGSSQTHLPDFGSPVIDSAGCAAPATDQRGHARPFGFGVDIGAAEWDDPAFDLQITGSSSRPSILAGGPFAEATVTQTIRVENLGPESAFDVVARFSPELGNEVAQHALTVSPGTTLTPATGLWEIGFLAMGEVATLEWTVQAAAGADPPQVRSDTVWIEADRPDSDGTNNAVTLVTPIERVVDLGVGVGIFAPPTEVIAGTTVDLHFGVGNSGPSYAFGPQVTADLTLPDGVRLVEASSDWGSFAPDPGDPTRGIWTIDVVRTFFGHFPTLTLRLDVPPSASTGSEIRNDAVLSLIHETEVGSRPNSLVQTVNVLREVDLEITVEESSDPVVAGDSLVYLVRASNHGPSNASGVALSLDLDLPTHVSLGSAAPSHGSYTESDSPDGVWSDFDLPAGGSATLEMTVDVGHLAEHDPHSPGNDITISAAITAANEPDSNPLNDQATAATSILSDFDFGDAPVGTPIVPGSATSTSYPTLLHVDASGVVTADGARHAVPVGGATVFLGAVPPDVDPNGQPSADATGDDTGIADEDGITFLDRLVPGQTVTLEVVTSGPGVLDAWIDFDRDGSWDPVAEKLVLTDVPFSDPPQKTLEIPANAASGLSFARFRFSSAGTPLPSGAARDGEVEDYVVLLEGLADIEITKTVDEPEPAQGQAVTFAIEASNLGPSDASDLIVSDPLPPGFELIGDLPSQGHYDPATGEWHVGSLAGNATATLEIAAIVAPEPGDPAGGAAIVDVLLEGGAGGATVATEMFFGPQGRLHLREVTATGGIFRFDAASGLPAPAPGQSGAYFVASDPSAPGALSAPTGAAFGPDGHLYVADSNLDDVLRYDGETGVFLDTFLENVSPQPEALTFDGAGNLYVADPSSDEILRFSGPLDAAPGSPLGAFVTAGEGGLAVPERLRFGPDGSLYIADRASEASKVLRASAAGVTDFVAAGSGGVREARALAFGPDGHLYLTDRFLDAVLRYDGVTGAPRPGPGHEGAVFFELAPGADPLDLAFDSKGVLHILEKESPAATEVARYRLVMANAARVVSLNEVDQVAENDVSVVLVHAALGSPELTLSKTDALAADHDGDGVVSPGDVVRYTLEAANVGSADAPGVELDDVAPALTSLVPGSVVASAGTVVSEDPVQVDLGAIAAGTTVTVSFDVLISSPFPFGIQEISNQASLSSEGLPDVLSDDPDLAGASDPTTTPVTTRPELRASKSDALLSDSDGDGSVSPGDVVRYTIVVANIGNGGSSGVVLRDLIPAHTSLVSGSLTTTAGTVISEDPVEVDLGLVPGGAAVTVTFDVLLEHPFPVGVQAIANQGTITSDQLPAVVTDDPDVGGDSDATETMVRTMPRVLAEKTAALAADHDGDGVPSPGDEIEYSVLLRNLGNVAATGVGLRDSIPEHTTVVPGSVTTSTGSVLSEDPVEISVGELAVDDEVHVGFRVTVMNPIPVGVDEIVNQGVVSADGIEDVPTDDPDAGGEADPTATPIRSAPVLAVEKTDVLFTDAGGDSVASPGDELLYRVEISNAGNTGATGVVLRDTIPANSSLVPGTVQTSQGVVVSEDPVAIQLGQVDVGTAATVTFRVVISDPFPHDVLAVSNQAVVESDVLDPVHSDDPETPSEADATATEVFILPEVSLLDSTLLEGDAGAVEAEITMVLSEPGNRPVTVSYQTRNGSAQSGLDYLAGAGTVTVPPGEVELGVSLSVLGDLLDEEDETLEIEIASIDGGSLADAVALVVILDDDDPPSISIDDVSVSEGDAGSVSALLTLLLSGPSGKPIAVDFSTVDGTARAGLDYQAVAGSVALPAGTTTETIAVEVLGDLVDEPDEVFQVVLANPVDVVLAKAQGSVTVLDDDLPPTLSIGDVSVIEGDPAPGAGDAVAVFDLTLSAKSGFEIQVDFATADISALAGSDYEAASGTVVLPAGSLSASVRVGILPDRIDELDEELTLRLSAPLHVLLAGDEGLATIVDDDEALISIHDVVVDEGNAGASDALFRVILATPADREISVDFTTAPETATSDVDYSSRSGTLTFPSGATEALLKVPVVGDTVLEELDETFRVELSAPVNTDIEDGLGRGTILDDEICAGPDLLQNGGAEDRDDLGQVAGWQVVEGVWQRSFAQPDPLQGRVALFAGSGPFAEIRQDVPVAAFASRIAGGAQLFAFSGFVRSSDEAPPDVGRIVVEYRDASNSVVLDAFDSGEIASPAAWTELSDQRPAPAGTAWVRVRLLATRFSGETSDVFFDALTLRSLRAPTVTIDDMSLVEGDFGSSDAVFGVRLACVYESDVSVRFESVDGDALADEDYLPVNGALSFPSGSTQQSLSVPVVGDEIDEPHESFFVQLSDLLSEGQPVFLDPRGRGLIRNDDFCQRSHGFWKNHPEEWPLAYALIGGLEVELDGLVWLLRSKGPDATLHLAKQLVATKLNLARGSDPAVTPMVEEADDFLAVFPPGSDPRGAERQLARELEDQLDSYNNACQEEDADEGQGKGED